MSKDGMMTLFVGIDGACADIVDPLAEKGAVPTLTSLRGRGVSAPLESQVPPASSSAWVSLSTGVNPGSHGIFGSDEGPGMESDPASRGVSEWTVWELLSLNDKRSVVVNAPVTRPYREFSGAFVPGRDGSGSSEWTPHGLRERFERDVGPYRSRPDPDEPPHREYPRVVRTRGDAFRYLADELDPALGFVVFDTPEAVLYEHPDDEELLETVYTAVDEQIGTLLDRYDPSTVIVASDHGMSRCDVEFQMNEFLRRNGFLVSTTEPHHEHHEQHGQHERSTGRSPSSGQQPVSDRRPSSETAHSDAETPISGLRRSISSRAKRLVRGIRGEDRMNGPTAHTASDRSTVDETASAAYMHSWKDPGIRVNFRTAGGEGVAPRDDYDHVRAELIDALTDLRTPAGELVFEDVARSETYYWGSDASWPTDIVVVPRDLTWSLSAELGGDVFTEPDRPWRPNFQGLLTIAGETVDVNADLSDAHLFDVAPTVLASLEVPVSDRMDGDVLPALPATRRFSYPLPEFDKIRDTHLGTGSSS